MWYLWWLPIGFVCVLLRPEVVLLIEDVWWEAYSDTREVRGCLCVPTGGWLLSTGSAADTVGILADLCSAHCLFGKCWLWAFCRQKSSVMAFRTSPTPDAVARRLFSPAVHLGRGQDFPALSVLHFQSWGVHTKRRALLLCNKSLASMFCVELPTEERERKAKQIGKVL